jgi:hexosaminidase
MIDNRARLSAVLILCSGLFVACTSSGPAGAPARPQTRAVVAPRVVPEPASIAFAGSDAFTITDSTSIVIESGNADVTRTAEQLGALVRPSTGFVVPISTTGASARGAIVLRLSADDALGAEGYRLDVSRDSVRITANAPAGLFHGVQTLRQLLPPQIESHMALSPMAWTIPAVRIADWPRYSWRGAMLDVARHFFSVREVKQYIDLLALYKMNVLHLHLADDQGWRIEIKSRPKLAAMGSVTQVGGGPGGYYTQDEYSDIVRYAQERYITIVPEIDLPGHINAALIGYPELSCSVRPPALYTGTEVGFSTLCANKEETYAFVDDVVREIAALTPGRYFHMGGDENPILSKQDYTKFVERTQDIIAKYGKQMVGWEEIAQARLRPTTLSQPWKMDTLTAAVCDLGAGHHERIVIARRAPVVVDDPLGELRVRTVRGVLGVRSQNYVSADRKIRDCPLAIPTRRRRAKSDAPSLRGAGDTYRAANIRVAPGTTAHRRAWLR